MNKILPDYSNNFIGIWRSFTGAIKLRVHLFCRQIGQDTAEELRSRDFKHDLIERERSSRDKSKKSSSDSYSSSKRQRLDQHHHAAIDADDPVDEEDEDDSDDR